MLNVTYKLAREKEWPVELHPLPCKRNIVTKAGVNPKTYQRRSLGLRFSESIDLSSDEKDEIRKGV